MNTLPVSYRWWITLLIFLTVAIISGATVAGPGLTWDEPPYRYSQIRLQQWFDQIRHASTAEELAELLSADTIDFYFVYNRVGSNFHPPMAGYLNLATWSVAGSWIDDMSARRLASSLELALTAALLCHFLGRRYGAATGVFAAFSLTTMPRVFGDAHIAGTDVPLMFFWTAAALAMVRALDSRLWQAVFALLWACLFLVKFSGNMIVLPAAITMAVYFIRRATPRNIVHGLVWSIALFVPMVPLAITLLWGKRDHVELTWAAPIVAFGLTHRAVMAFLFFWPAVVWFAHRFTRRPASWPIGFELPWMTAAIAPLVIIALNPTWWHDPVGGLASYFDLCLRRQGYLPDIAIFYLGKEYIYSLPWHNAWVLMALTIPFGLLGLGIVGTVRALMTAKVDWIPLYFVLHALTLPVVRMFEVPAHDGVRLFLPTFAFWAGLAGLGALWITSRTKSGWAWPILFLLGPVWGGWEIARIHPHELSYYNIGLSRQALGMEVSYWYDAVTPTVLRDLNERLPKGAVLAYPSPAINLEIIPDHQSMGSLRADIVLDVSKGKGFPYMLLLTHSSKATAFSRFLYVMTPWYASNCEGVPLFSVIDPHHVAIAWGLHFLSTEYHDPNDPFRTPSVNERIFQVEAASILRAVELIARDGPDVRHHLVGESEEVASLVNQWTENGQVRPDLALLLAVDRSALDEAIEILERRGKDIRTIVTTPGYPPSDRFGGYLDNP